MIITAVEEAAAAPSKIKVLFKVALEGRVYFKTALLN
jgi:hypothetical protein